MPVSFGPAPGPRNLPADQHHRRYDKEVVSITQSALTDPELLSYFLPEGLSLHGDPRLEINLTSFRNIGWLAGRGYDILMIRLPACWKEGGRERSGFFVPVVWENMADPIITGREELGWAKVFADISVNQVTDASWACEASWDGHSFFRLEASGFQMMSPPESASPMVFEKFIPATGDQPKPDAHYLTVTEPDGPAPKINDASEGSGKFAFHSASWEQMPTQFPIVSALAQLPLDDFSSVTRLETSGGGDGSAQRRLNLLER